MKEPFKQNDIVMCDNLSWEAQDIQGFIWRVEDDDGTGVVIVPAFGVEPVPLDVANVSTGFAVLIPLNSLI